MNSQVPNAVAATSTPTLVSNNAFDGFTLFDMGGIKSLKHTNASSEEFKYVQYVGQTLRNSIMKHVKPTDGVFLTACVQHEMAWNPQDGKHGPFGPTIDGCTHAEAVRQHASASPQPSIILPSRVHAPFSAPRLFLPENLVMQLCALQVASFVLKTGKCKLVTVDATDDFASLIKVPCNTGVFN